MWPFGRNQDIKELCGRVSTLSGKLDELVDTLQENGRGSGTPEQTETESDKLNVLDQAIQTAAAKGDPDKLAELLEAERLWRRHRADQRRSYFQRFKVSKTERRERREPDIGEGDEESGYEPGTEITADRVPGLQPGNIDVMKFYTFIKNLVDKNRNWIRLLGIDKNFEQSAGMTLDEAMAQFGQVVSSPEATKLLASKLGQNIGSILKGAVQKVREPEGAPAAPSTPGQGMQYMTGYGPVDPSRPYKTS